MVIKFIEHLLNSLLTFRVLILINIYAKLKLINQIHKILYQNFNMFNIVNKSIVLQRKFKNMKDFQYNKNYKILYTINT